MGAQESAAIVKQAYEAFGRGDLQGLLDSLTDDVVWETPAVRGASFGGRRQGKQGVAAFFSELLQAEEVLLFDMSEYIAQGERVAVLGRYRGRVKATGQIAETPLIHVFTIRKGKIANFFELYDTAAAERAYQQAASA
ncbi:MAG: nuclear transport factor 2 family protein [Bryobacteraceae bacterium]|nr:nuclear transport factor 2 family protein [Bryobacteraceae bacterium]